MPTFAVGEASAILTYLALKYNVPDHWYPSELRACTRVDAALHWQQRTLRCAHVFIATESRLKNVFRFSRACPALAAAHAEVRAACAHRHLEPGLNCYIEVGSSVLCTGCSTC